MLDPNTYPEDKELYSPVVEGASGVFTANETFISQEVTPVVETKEQRTRTRLRKVGDFALGAVLAVPPALAFGFEQGPWNEALRINKGLDVLKSTQSAIAVGVVVAAITIGIEMIPSTLISLGLNRDKGLVGKFNDYLRAKNEIKVKEYNEHQEQKAEKREQEVGRVRTLARKIRHPLGKIATKSSDIGFALAGGAGILAAKRHFESSDPSLKEDMINSVKGTGIIAGFSGAVGYLAAGGINTVSKVGLEKPAQFIIDYGTDKKFWYSILGVGYAVFGISKGVKALRRRISGFKEQPVSSEPPTINPEPLGVIETNSVL